MSDLQPDDLLQLMAQAFEFHRRGELPRAEAIYRNVLAIQPNHTDALQLLGSIALQTGRNDSAVELIGKSIQIRPNLAETHYNLGIALERMKKLKEAVVSFRTAIALKPDFVKAHGNLGNALAELGQQDQAIAAYRAVIQLKADSAEAFSNLGNVLRKQGRLDEALASLNKAIQLKPNFAEAHCNLAIALREKGQLDQAIDACRTAIQLKPDYAEAYGGLGTALTDRREYDQAIVAFRTAIALKPDFAEAHNNLGLTLLQKGLMDLAVASFGAALQLKPDYLQAHTNLANALKDQGELDRAIAGYRAAIQIDPGYVEPHDNLILAMHYHPSYDARAIADEHARWNRRHAEPLRQFIQPHSNDRDPERRLRIGYVSPDLRDHPVGRFILPLLAHHDKTQFEVFAYAQVPVPDAMTRRLHDSVDGWRNIVGLSDAQAADLIRQDRIDILVDLAMHTSHNRLLVFARKPAPLQVTYLAYCSSTGPDTIDYRLSDPCLDPPGVDESIYSEQTIRLPETYWCYEPGIAAPETGPLPALKHGFITFGCLNNFCKISQPALMTWARLLLAVPKSRLLIHAHEGSHRQRLRDQLANQGVEPDRVEFVGYKPAKDYFELYNRIDISLDTFPYAGGTTTCDALWMGTPVVSLAGQTAVGRGGLSILSNVGLPELVGDTQDEYVRIATGLANDLPRLGQLRSTLRQRMSASPVMNQGRFAGGVEAVYRTIWRRWCGI